MHRSDPKSDATRDRDPDRSIWTQIYTQIQTLREPVRARIGYPTVALGIVRACGLSLLVTLWLSAPVGAQISDPSGACSTEAASIIESFVMVLMGFVPAIATIIVLGSFVALMATRDPSKKADTKSTRNSAILYGWILAPALGIIISLLSTLTGNPILECITF